MPRGILISDSYGHRVARYLAPLGLDVVAPRPGATIGDVLQAYLGDGGWDYPSDPFNLDRYEVRDYEIERNFGNENFQF